jgi:DNA-binding MarR family transcriptional regulator
MTDQPDLAILIAAGYRALADRLRAEMERAGLADMRSSYGFVIRAVAAEEPTINRLAELLEVTKQAASRMADEMERDGFIERRPDPDDRRRLRLCLTAKGRRVRKRALATSAAMEREVSAELGEEALQALRAGLLAIVRQEGALEDVLARRAKPVW